MAVKDLKILAIADLLDQQVLDPSMDDGTIYQKLALKRRTFYRLKPEAIALQQRRSNERQKIIEDTNTSEMIEAVKNGLKSKTERLMTLQKQVDKCEAELEINESKKDEGKSMSVFEKVALRKVLRDLQSEISKIQGDYPAEKKEITGKDGKPIQLQAVSNIDYTKLSDEVLEQIASAKIETE